MIQVCKIPSPQAILIGFCMVTVKVLNSYHDSKNESASCKRRFLRVRLAARVSNRGFESISACLLRDR